MKVLFATTNPAKIKKYAEKLKFGQEYSSWGWLGNGKIAS